MSPTTLFGFIVAVLAVLLITFFTYRSMQARAVASDRVTKTFEVLGQLEALVSSLKDAETGQRGFVLTGFERYLEPHTQASISLPGELKRMRQLMSDSPQQLARLDQVDRLAAVKMSELMETIVLRRAGDFEGALAIVKTDRGKAAMDELRAVIAEMRNEEQRQLAARNLDWQDAAAFSSNVTWSGSALLLFLIASAFVMTARDYRARETQMWLRSGQLGLSARLQGEQRLETLGQNVLAFLAEYLDAQVAAIYLDNDAGGFRRFSGYALPAAAEGKELVIKRGEGLVGQVAKDGHVLHLSDAPEGLVPISSGLGETKPRQLLLAPSSAGGAVNAVVELGFLHPVDAADRELLERVSEMIGVAVRSAKDRSKLEELLEETQRQSEELQAQQEELRVSNEELEEQSRALKESQTRLEGQHAELEQTNTQLEEQTQLLEDQKEELSQTQLVMVDKARELEKANTYKSEFLANMSHELRTPLNSSLILAKLLADNKSGNLTAEQVKFAQTISSAGNDLLSLINDILDLAKIEAGKVEVQPESVHIQRALEGLFRTLQPMAQEKGLELTMQLDPGSAQRIETDAQRLGQILKNLLSNALKFTAKGGVSLRVSSSEGRVAFAVKDTGIGVAAHQHEIIFKAFHQADGSTHRKYGGTGLGLSISRDLARLLGGDISVQSVPGEGSTFTLVLPLVYAGPGDLRAPAAVSTAAQANHFAAPPAARPQPARAPAPATTLAPPGMEDDRERLAGESRVILVIEDDLRFASILRDLAHELGFLCIATHTASDGLAAALQYRPSAIVLDMNLPDHSGLGVLDQLKRNPLTRHIPVHVVSVEDYAREALELGAVGYALKPVKRDLLVDAFHKLEAKFSQSVRRVLVVEDDERQRDSIRQLLGNDEVQITAVASASEALVELQKMTFDCMVMDLNLPDLSGYELLKKMAEQDTVAFPPVIVYTGRSLTRDEEQKLRRFSKSIIIKDARSPERLLDEVTLFIHQVEAKLPVERQRMLKESRSRESTLEGRRILVVEDDVRNIFALSSLLEPKGAKVEIARNGREALEALAKSMAQAASAVDLVLMDIMMPEMDGLTAMREIRKNPDWKKLPIIALTAKAMKDDQEKCLAAGANDYIAKPLDVEKLLSLVRVWMPK